MLPQTSGEFAVVFEPELKFSNDGKAWVRIRGVAKDRSYNEATKEWEDKGDPCFLDIIFGGKQAENVVESVIVGDYITVNGRLNQREWVTAEGEKRTSYQIRADYIGIGVRFTAWSKNGAPRTVPATVGSNTAPPAQSDDVPF